MSYGPERRQIDRLRQRRQITRLQWQLARLISRNPGGGNLAA
jgi:hypothetical protein